MRASERECIDTRDAIIRSLSPSACSQGCVATAPIYFSGDALLRFGSDACTCMLGTSKVYVLVWLEVYTRTAFDGNVVTSTK